MRRFPIGTRDANRRESVWQSRVKRGRSDLVAGDRAANGEKIGAGEIFAGVSMALLFDDPRSDPRTPDIAVQPNAGVIYTGGKKKVAEHGGFAPDDTNVMLLLSNAGFAAGTVFEPVQTTSVAPTILRVLGINPTQLEAVRKDNTTILPGLSLVANQN